MYKSQDIEGKVCEVGRSVGCSLCECVCASVRERERWVYFGCRIYVFGKKILKLTDL
jgi:hypothetical protein